MTNIVAPSDYTSIFTTLTFIPGDERQCVDVDAREDNIAEVMENFIVVLNSTDSVDLVPDEAVVDIIDDNSKKQSREINSFEYTGGTCGCEMGRLRGKMFVNTVCPELVLRYHPPTSM